MQYVVRTLYPALFAACCVADLHGDSHVLSNGQFSVDEFTIIKPDLALAEQQAVAAGMGPVLELALADPSSSVPASLSEVGKVLLAVFP